MTTDDPSGASPGGSLDAATADARSADAAPGAHAGASPDRSADGAPGAHVSASPDAATADTRPADAPPSRQRALAIVATLLFAGIVVPLIAILFAMRSCSRPAMSGHLELTGSSLGAYRVTLDRCRATVSPDEIELGTAATPALVRVTLDPLDGPVLTVHDQTASRFLTVPTRPCTGFIARLTRTSAEGAARFTYDGEVTGTCPLPGGGAVVLSSWFRACGG